MRNERDELINLQPLIKTWDNWMVESTKRVYFINVCHVLVKTRQMPAECHANTMFCSVARQESGVARADVKDLGMTSRPRLRDGNLCATKRR